MWHIFGMTANKRSATCWAEQIDTFSFDFITNFMFTFDLINCSIFASEHPTANCYSFYRIEYYERCWFIDDIWCQLNAMTLNHIFVDFLLHWIMANQWMFVMIITSQTRSIFLANVTGFIFEIISEIEPRLWSCTLRSHISIV